MLASSSGESAAFELRMTPGAKMFTDGSTNVGSQNSRWSSSSSGLFSGGNTEIGWSDVVGMPYAVCIVYAMTAAATRSHWGSVRSGRSKSPSRSLICTRGVFGSVTRVSSCTAQFVTRGMSPCDVTTFASSRWTLGSE